MTLFNVIAYRTNGDDTCRGQVMDSTDSVCSIFNSTDMSETATHIAELKFSDTTTNRATSSYEISIIINGICVKDEIDSNWYNYNTELYDVAHTVLDELEALSKLELVAMKKEQVIKDANAKEANIKDEAAKEQLKIVQAKAKIIDDYNKLMMIETTVNND
jgi:hypothetical protein